MECSVSSAETPGTHTVQTHQETTGDVGLEAYLTVKSNLHCMRHYQWPRSRGPKLTSCKQPKRAAFKSMQVPRTPTPGRQARRRVASASLIAVVFLALSVLFRPSHARALAPAAAGVDKAGVLVQTCGKV